MVRLLRTAASLTLVLLIGIGAANCSLFDSGTGEPLVNFLYDWDEALYFPQNGTEPIMINFYSEALGIAKNEKKPVMINFYIDFCPSCNQLDLDTLYNEELSDFLSDNFICLRSNSGESNLYRDYDIKGYPTTVFTSPKGILLGGIIGYSPPDFFYQYAQEMLGKWKI